MNFKTSLLISGALAAYISPQIDPDTIALPDSEPHPIVQSVNGCSAIGAYKDKLFDRAMSYRSLVDTDYGLSYELCKDACSDYTYFGIQNNYYECWCDNDLDEVTKHGEGNCGVGGSGLCNYVYECGDLMKGEKILYVDQHYGLTGDEVGRAKGSCISFKNSLQRNLDRYAGTSDVELWVTVTSDPTECALVEFQESDIYDEYYIYMKGRVDGAQIIPGYLGSRYGAVDTRDNKSVYMSATQQPKSSFRISEKLGGVTLYSSGYYIQAITSNGDPIHQDGKTSDLILGYGIYTDNSATIFQIESLDEEKATKVMAAMMTLLVFTSYL